MAGLRLGIETGGTAPRGFRTSVGNDPRLAKLGLVEHPSWAYKPRTECNIRDSDGTVVIGKHWSPGSKLTINICDELQKPYFLQPWVTGQEIPDPTEFRTWLEDNKIQILNVAGNGEDRNPGIGRATISFIMKVLSQ